MPFDFQRARPLLHSGDLTKLFVEELGWEPCRQKLILRAGETDHAFTAIAEKRGFTARLCASTDSRLPDHTTRLKLDRALAQTSFEHLIVFATPDRVQQSWVWVRREPGRPLSARTHEFNRAQPGDSLLQKLQVLYVSLEEEEQGDLSTITIAERARAAFDIERVTKAFYRDFDTHRKAFLKFIDGIGEVADREWYASVMLNRLMFVYFIQRKGFLDADPAYLRNRLLRCQKEKGKDKFYTFYRYFLLRLFHEGFGKRRKDRAPDLERLLGNIPYLNGGLFDVHELEKPDRYGKGIQIPDKAFERVFDYFDQYQWYLDERPLRDDKEINPDVLGYIFEKYINQKQMGAYYTKEDITEYISKSTVLPFLFDAARAKCKVAFDPQPSTTNSQPTVWDLLRENPDRYIYPAVRHGADKKLPQEIAAGLDAAKPGLIQRRKLWNKPAPGEYALPTEIWREVVARRQRYWEVWSRLSGRQASPAWVANPPQAAIASPSPGGEGRGEGGTVPPIRDINDFITLNLDLRQFAQDIIQSCEGPDLLMAFWQAITTITVLDPTGGSGAFIFAALNILEPLYEACLDRMEAFLTEWGEAGKKLHPNYHKKFTEVLANVAAHPNRRYFVLKSIILNNLYAVDIMEEAVEICKLRLFLKLAAQVEPDAGRDNLGIEPLPDIDFNIRAGNTLVGYATKQEVQRCMKEVGGGQMKLMDEADLGSFARFNTRCADVEQAFAKFRQLQTEGDGSVPAADKLELQKRLKALEDELNRHLGGDYGVKVSDKAAFANWVKSHQPFHWFIQFYGILHSGGFDVIIGNPPYYDLKQGLNYILKGYTTLPTKNLYPIVIERCIPLARQSGRLGFIVPVSSISTEGYAELQDLILKLPAHLSSYDDRPARLFDGLEHIQLTIHLLENRRTEKPEHFVTECYRWSAVERDNLFPTIEFESVESHYLPGCVPKISTAVEHSILRKLWADAQALGSQTTASSRHQAFYSRKVHNFLQALDFVPKVFDGKGKLRPPSELKSLTFQKYEEAEAAFCILNSTLFRWFVNVFSDCRHVNKREVEGFRCDLSRLLHTQQKQVSKLAEELSASLQKTSEFREMRFAHDRLRVQCIIPKFSKPIIDRIDTVLAGHYGFTVEELDFILNYDIKYRLGRDTETEEE